MANPDVRWLKRFDNYQRALAQLTKFMQQAELNELEEQGFIQAFEYTHELAWKVQKDFLEDQGFTDLFGSKNVAREAFNTGLIKDGEVWLDMIKSRNLSSHTYNQATTDKIITAIREHYFTSFNALSERLKLLAAQQCGNE